MKVEEALRSETSQAPGREVSKRVAKTRGPWPGPGHSSLPSDPKQSSPLLLIVEETPVSIVDPRLLKLKGRLFRGLSVGEGCYSPRMG